MRESAVPRVSRPVATGLEIRTSRDSHVDLATSRDSTPTDASEPHDTQEERVGGGGVTLGIPQLPEEIPQKWQNLDVGYGVDMVRIGSVHVPATYAEKQWRLLQVCGRERVYVCGCVREAGGGE